VSAADARLPALNVPASARADLALRAQRPGLLRGREVAARGAGLGQGGKPFTAGLSHLATSGCPAEVLQRSGPMLQPELAAMLDECRTDLGSFPTLCECRPGLIERGKGRLARGHWVPLPPLGQLPPGRIGQSVSTRIVLAQPLGVGSTDGLTRGSPPPLSHPLAPPEPEPAADIAMLGRSVVAVRSQVLLRDARPVERVAAAVGEPHVVGLVRPAVPLRKGPPIRRRSPRASTPGRFEVAPPIGAYALRHRAFERGDAAFPRGGYQDRRGLESP